MSHVPTLSVAFVAVLTTAVHAETRNRATTEVAADIVPAVVLEMEGRYLRAFTNTSFFLSENAELTLVATEDGMAMASTDVVDPALIARAGRSIAEAHGRQSATDASGRAYPIEVGHIFEYLGGTDEGLQLEITYTFIPAAL